jgi:hypothetical protein
MRCQCFCGTYPGYRSRANALHPVGLPCELGVGLQGAGGFSPDCESARNRAAAIYGVPVETIARIVPESLKP